VPDSTVEDRILSGQNLWRRVKASVVALFSGQLISAAGTLAVVPIFLAHWSPVRYGEWLTLSSLIAYLSALDLGMNLAGSNRLAQEYARGDMDGFNRYLDSAMAFYLAIAAAGTLILGIVVCSVPIGRLLGLRAAGPREAAIVAFLIGVQVLWSMPASLAVGVFRTMGDFARTQWFRNTIDVAVLVLTALLLQLGAGMIELATAQLCCLAIVTVVAIGDLHKRYPALVPGMKKASISAIRELVRPSLHFGLIILGTLIAVQGPVLLVSASLGGAAVALFASTRTLANMGRQLVSMVSLALWPQVTALEAQQQLLRVRQLHRLWVIGSTAACVSVAAALWFEGADVIRVWTRGRLHPDTTLLRLLLLQIILQVPWQASSVITGASNRHDKLSYAYLFSSLVGISVAAVLIRRMGTSAIPVAWIVGEGLVCYYFVIRDTCRKIGEPYWGFAVRQWTYLSLALAVALLVAWWIHGVAAGPSVLRWAEVGMATVVASVATLWTVGFTRDERRQLTGLFQLARVQV
jgi:O-antigen/teichoic acid export membrane protein